MPDPGVLHELLLPKAELITTSDGAHYAAVQREPDADRARLEHDGSLYGEFEQLGDVRLDARGELAFVYRAGRGWHVRAGDRLSPAYDVVRDLAVSCDGRVSYVARSGRSWLVVSGEQQVEHDDLVRDPLVARDGRLVYRARKGKKWHVVDGAALSDAWTEVSGLELDVLDRTLYRGRKGQRAVLVVAGEAHGREHRFESIGDARVSRDGQRLLYVGYRVDPWGKHHVVIDGDLGPAYAGVGELVVSANGEHVAHAALLEPGWQLVRDRQVVSEPCDVIHGLTADEAFTHWAWIERRAAGDLVLAPGFRAGPFARAGAPCLGPDGRVAFARLEPGGSDWYAPSIGAWVHAGRARGDRVDELLSGPTFVAEDLVEYVARTGRLVVRRQLGYHAGEGA